MLNVKFFQLLIIVIMIAFTSSCGKNGALQPYPGYPKAYPAIHIDYKQ